MEQRPEPIEEPSTRRSLRGVGPRLAAWIVLVFVVTLIVFVGLDIHHESRFAKSIGADAKDRAELLWNTLALHTVHAAVTVLAFGLAIHFLVRRLVSARIERLVLAIQHFRRGIWKVRIPTRMYDELEWLTDALRELGPDLESKLTTFVEADRKSVVALQGSRYERMLLPPTHRILAAAREARHLQRKEGLCRAIEGDALTILAELDRLGRPEHPTNTDLVTLDRATEIAGRGSDGGTTPGDEGPA